VLSLDVPARDLDRLGRGREGRDGRQRQDEQRPRGAVRSAARKEKRNAHGSQERQNGTPEDETT
jgi:hypothetical protein